MYRIATVCLLLLLSAILACSGGEEKPAGGIGSESGTPVATEQSTNSPLQSPTATPVEVTETIQPFDCGVFDALYCSLGKLTEFNIDGVTASAAVFDLPEGVAIHAPFSGQLWATADGFALNAAAPILDINLLDSDVVNVFFSIGGDFRLAGGINMDSAALAGVNVDEGQVVAYTTETGISVGDGSLAIAMSSYDPAAGTRDEISQLLAQFPYLANP